MVDEAMSAILDKKFKNATGNNNSKFPANWQFAYNDGRFYYTLENEEDGAYISDAVIVMDAPKIGYEVKNILGSYRDDVPALAKDMNAVSNSTTVKNDIIKEITIDVYTRSSFKMRFYLLLYLQERLLVTRKL